LSSAEKYIYFNILFNLKQLLCWDLRLCWRGCRWNQDWDPFWWKTFFFNL